MSEHPSKRNRLQHESSPYLLLHQDNPVDWYPWGEAAIAEARRGDRPIFLSVGYSTCYWCHVMERESFSEPAIAELMNRDFVNVKVDREERPDLDEIYMTATQILTHHGGWPNSVFLTPQLEPFFAGTYFPPRDRPGQPGMATVLRSLAEAWRTRRDEVEEQAAAVAAAMRRLLEEAAEPGGGLPPADLADQGLADLARRFDSSWGGFGAPPKFPTPANLWLLLELADADRSAAEMLDRTLQAMACGGIYDQLAGGFHRYATDREWRIPHFEKMLYDNGLLLEIFARQWRRNADPEAARVVRETIDFLGTEMTDAEGAFWSAIDAETDGREGAYYVWTRDELRQLLREEDFGFLSPLLGFADRPFFEEHSYVLHLPAPLAAQAERRRMSVAGLLAEMAPLRASLLAARRRRPRPATDDKVLADWNGTAIAGMAEAGRIFAEPRWVEQAARAAEFVLSRLRPEGDLVHSWRRGRVGVGAFLADYAYLVRGLLALHRATGGASWLEAALDLTVEQERRLADERGGFFVAADSDDLLSRSKEIMDGAMPAANAVAVLNLVRLAEVTGDRAWRDHASAALRAFAAQAERHPAAVKSLAVGRLRFAKLEENSDAVLPLVARAPESSLQAEVLRAVRAGLRVGAVDAEGFRSWVLRLDIDAGWHLSAPDSGAGGPQAVSIAGAGLELADLQLPRSEPANRRPGEDEPRVYRGTVEIRGRLRPTGKDAGRMRVRFQACDRERCLPPTELELPVD